MSGFIKWGCWVGLILSWPICIITSTEIGIGWGFLSFYLMICISHKLEERCNALCEGVEDIDTLNAKLADGADLNAKGASDRRPLIETIKRSNDVNLIKIMIQKGANVNIKGDNETPLTVALRYGKYNIAKLLISQGAVIENDIYIDGAFVERNELLLKAGVNITDSRIAEIVKKFGELLEEDDKFWSKQYALTFKLFIKYNVDLSKFWHHSIATYIFRKAWNYPDIQKKLSKKNTTSQENVKLINSFLDKILEETK